MTKTTSSDQTENGWSDADRIGLCAGWGDFPIRVAEALKRQDRAVYCLGIRDHADRERLTALCDGYHEVGMAKMGAAIRFFRRHDVRFATMAGKIHKVFLFQRFAWLKHFPDCQGLMTFAPHYVTKSKDRKDDSLMLSIVASYGRAGITLAPPTDFAPELLVKHGKLSKRGPSRSVQLDIAFGWELAKQLGALDVGQSVAVKGRAVLAVEAVEGTDQCIRRAGELCKQGGFTVVKVAKPQQDMRFDVPTIGVGTLQSLVEAGGATLAIEADKTIIIDEPQVIEYADRHGVTLVAVHDGNAARLDQSEAA